MNLLCSYNGIVDNDNFGQNNTIQPPANFPGVPASPQIVMNPSQPTQPLSPINDTNDSNHKTSRIKIILLIILIFILVAGIAIGTYLIQQKQIFKSKAAEPIIAQVNGDKLTASEFNKTKAFFADLSNKPETDQSVSQQALKFEIEHKLLQKYAAEQGVLDEANQIADSRFNNIVQNTAADQTTAILTSQDKDAYKEYVLDQAIREQLQQSAIEWKKVHFLSIRYHFDDNDIENEKTYKEMVDQKIKEYQSIITNEKTIKEAIKKRCQDADIDYLPYDPDNHIYNKTFNDKTCREQGVDLKISSTANPMFGNNWLQQVFANTKKGEVSQIIDYTDKNLGMYFLVYEIDEGGESSSLSELIDSLKNTNQVQIYQNQ